ncbi:antigen WC1.1-like [Boleophthalmus pectinirostris]|uniref:antigen WC1.1-like n=1 Tax=Boleophthalmus pectinirostris TaxID=150288 RepID=UPI00242CA297|nr:antigen WC1.1-like [Boleophthalmus pectinirostris]
MFLRVLLWCCGVMCAGVLCAGVQAENNSSADSVRLVSGSGLCSGSVQIWDGSWTGVCDGDLDQRGAEVLCRELDCGAPSLLQGALSPLGQTFHCEGHESALMDCPRSNSSTCSSGATVNLTCSEPIRLVGGASRCAGTVEVKHRGEWRRVKPFGDWNQEHTAGVCRDLDCGSAVYGEERDDFPESRVWWVTADCVKTYLVRGCVVASSSSSSGLEVVCSELLNRPIISVSVSDGASELQPQGVRVQLGSKFRVKCSVEPQYPGGSFRLLSPAAPPAQNRTLPAVNHSAHFLFSDADHAHKGNYTCVYLLQVFNHNFSSQSHTLQLSVGESVRLVSGSGLCSGSVQIWDGSWTGVCDGDLDQRGAEVLCRELGCGAPSLLQGALSPLGQTFHCEGHESALMDCPRSNSSTCSSGATVNLTCSEPIRLVGGSSRCAGTVEVKHRGEWRRVDEFYESLLQEDIAVVCRDLDCGSAVYGERTLGFPQSRVWRVKSDCVKKSSVSGCIIERFPIPSSWGLQVKCSGKSLIL